jgi:hypothetical protein
MDHVEKKNEKSPCMKKGKCSKYYPKEFQDETTFTDNGFIQYVDETAISTSIETIII